MIVVRVTGSAAQTANISDPRAALRKVREDHITSIGVYIIDALANLADANARDRGDFDHE